MPFTVQKQGLNNASSEVIILTEEMPVDALNDRLKAAKHIQCCVNIKIVPSSRQDLFYASFTRRTNPGDCLVRFLC